MSFDYSKLRGRMVEKYGSQIAIKKGLEFGIQEHTIPKFKTIDKKAINVVLFSKFNSLYFLINFIFFFSPIFTIKVCNKKFFYSRCFTKL